MGKTKCASGTRYATGRPAAGGAIEGFFIMSIAATIAHQGKSAKRVFFDFCDDENGATAIEYGLIFLAIIGAVKSFGSTTNEMYNEIETEINSVIN